MNAEERPEGRSTETRGRVARVPDGSARTTAVEWLEEAIRLDDENRQLRAWLTSLLFWVAEQRDLADLARAQIGRRFGEAA